MNTLPFTFQNPLTNPFSSLYACLHEHSRLHRKANGRQWRSGSLLPMGRKWTLCSGCKTRNSSCKGKKTHCAIIAIHYYCFSGDILCWFGCLFRFFFLYLFSTSSFFQKLTSPENIGSFWSRPVKSVIQDWTNWKRSQNHICTWSRIRLDCLSWKQSREEWHGLTWLILLAPDFKVESMNHFFLKPMFSL